MATTTYNYDDVKWKGGSLSGVNFKGTQILRLHFNNGGEYIHKDVSDTVLGYVANMSGSATMSFKYSGEGAAGSNCCMITTFTSGPSARCNAVTSSGTYSHAVTSGSLTASVQYSLTGTSGWTSVTNNGSIQLGASWSNLMNRSFTIHFRMVVTGGNITFDDGTTKWVNGITTGDLGTVTWTFGTTEPTDGTSYGTKSISTSGNRVVDENGYAYTNREY